MTRVDREAITDALDEGFQEATAEKVHRLLEVLRELQARQDAKDRFTLKGGTALNVFHLPRLPRLSVDIDIMATGFPEAKPDTDEREAALHAVDGTLTSLGYRVSRKRNEDDGAGVTFHGAYRNRLGDEDLIKVDVDLLNRQTLFPAQDLHGPTLFFADDLAYPSVAPSELLAQKLVAVAYRAHPRDLFDMHQMLQLEWHARPRAREAYLAYSLLSDGEAEWYRLDYPTRLEVRYQPRDLADVLRAGDQAPTLEEMRRAATDALTGSPDFTIATEDDERLREELVSGRREAFADLLRETDADRRRRLADHPGLEWRLSQL